MRVIGQVVFFLFFFQKQNFFVLIESGSINWEWGAEAALLDELVKGCSSRLFILTCVGTDGC